MSSLFRRRPPAVSFLFLEVLGGYVLENPEATTEDALRHVCDELDLDHANIPAYIEKIREGAENSSAQEKKASTQRKIKTYGSDYDEYLKKLEADKLCLIVSGFDYEKAKRLYSIVDKDIAEEIIEDFFSYQTQLSQLQFEGCMYGFGNSYNEKGKGKPADEVVDLAAGDSSGFNDLASAFSSGF